jgi:hypothetical protein
MCYDWVNSKSTSFSEEEEEEIELHPGKERMKVSEILENVVEDESSKSDKKIFRAVKKLQSWFNPQTTNELNNSNHGKGVLLE